MLRAAPRGLGGSGATTLDLAHVLARTVRPRDGRRVRSD